LNCDFVGFRILKVFMVFINNLFLVFCILGRDSFLSFVNLLNTFYMFWILGRKNFDFEKGCFEKEFHFIEFYDDAQNFRFYLKN